MPVGAGTTGQPTRLIWVPYNEHSVPAVHRWIETLGMNPYVFGTDNEGKLLARTEYIGDTAVTSDSCAEDIPRRVLENGNGFDRVGGVVTAEFVLERLYRMCEECGDFDLRTDGRFHDPRRYTEPLLGGREVVIRGREADVVLRLFPVDEKLLARYVHLRPSESNEGDYGNGRPAVFVGEDRLRNFSTATLQSAYPGSEFERFDVTRGVERNVRGQRVKQSDAAMRGEPDKPVMGGDLYQSGGSAMEYGLVILNDFGLQPLVEMEIRNGRHK
jgi:hypothetical protein